MQVTLTAMYIAGLEIQLTLTHIHVEFKCIRGVSGLMRT